MKTPVQDEGQLHKIRVEPMGRRYVEPVLKMWLDLLELTSKVNARYTLSSRAVSEQRKFFAKHADNPNTYCYVALAGDEPVGFVNGYLILPSKVFIQEEIGMLENLFVKDDYRRQGIGHQLVRVSYEWFDRFGIREVYVNVVPANETSFHFWSAMGFDVHKLTMARSLR